MKPSQMEKRIQELTQERDELKAGYLSPDDSIVAEVAILKKIVSDLEETNSKLEADTLTMAQKISDLEEELGEEIDEDEDEDEGDI